MGYPSLMFLAEPSEEIISPDVFEDLKLMLLLSEDAVKSMRYVCEKEDILARHELFRVLENDALRAQFKVLAQDMAELARLYDAYMESASEDEQRVIYVSLLKCAAQFGYDAVDFKGSGVFFERFHEFFVAEVSRPEYDELSEDLDAVYPHLAEIQHCSFKITGDNMHITSTVANTYVDRLAACAENLGLASISTQRAFSRPLPPDIIEAIAALYPDVFEYFDWFYEKYEGFFNDGIMIYRGELAFYLELSEIFEKLRTNGIPVVYPEISTDRQIRVQNAYDITLLAKNEQNIVPNDIFFSEKEPFYYLTGANGGGKTTYLRAVGAVVVFFLNGCPLACESASLCPLKNVYTHFPRDERFDSGGRFQNENALVNEILEAEGGNSLVLLNETYSATSEELAVPLTVALAERLYKSGSFGIYITHQHGVGETEIPFLNVVVDLSDSNRRTYKISRQQGNLGSLALDILKKYRLDRESLEERFGGRS